MEYPLVCVCIPCFNSEKTIIETLGTIQNQSYPNIEIHIFDNASTDKTVECIEKIADERIYIHIAESTGNAELNFTRCMNLGRGEYTTLFHADDLYASDIIEKQVGFLEQNRGTSGVLTFATQINDRGELGKTYLAPKSLNMEKGEAKSFDLESLFKAVLKHDNFLFCPSAMIRTSVCVNELKEWGGEEFKTSADLHVWLRLAAFNHIALINEPLLFYRLSESQYTAGYRRSRKTKADIFPVLDYWLKNEGLKESLTDADLVNYQKLQRYDALGCMLNAMRDNEISLAKDIWAKGESFSVARELMQIRSVRDVKFFMLSSGLKLMLLPLAGWALRPILLKYLNQVRL